MGTKEEYLEDFGIDYTKLWVMSAICIGTIIGNVAVILAIVARNIKVIYEHDYFNSAAGFNFNFIETICIFVFLLVLNTHPYFLPTQMTRMYYFIIHLSIADLLTALLTLLPEIVWTATIDFYGGNVVCKLTKFAQMIGPYLR